MSWSFEFTAKDKHAAHEELRKHARGHSANLPLYVQEFIGAAIDRASEGHPVRHGYEEHIHVKTHGHLAHHGSHGREANCAIEVKLVEVDLPEDAA